MTTAVSENEVNMSFDLNENQEMIAQMISDFGDKEIRPNMRKWDETQEFPIDLFKKLGDLGLMGVFVPQEFGGTGFSYREYVTVISEISKINSDCISQSTLQFLQSILFLF